MNSWKNGKWNVIVLLARLFNSAMQSAAKID